jgi:hypothetical protein
MQEDYRIEYGHNKAHIDDDAAYDHFAFCKAGGEHQDGQKVAQPEKTAEQNRRILSGVKVFRSQKTGHGGKYAENELEKIYRQAFFLVSFLKDTDRYLINAE